MIKKTYFEEKETFDSKFINGGYNKMTNFASNSNNELNNFKDFCLILTKKMSVYRLCQKAFYTISSKQSF